VLFGRAILLFDRTILPFDSAILLFDRTILPFDRTILPFDRIILPFDRIILPFDRIILPGRCSALRNRQRWPKIACLRGFCPARAPVGGLAPAQGGSGRAAQVKSRRPGADDRSQRPALARERSPRAGAARSLWRPQAGKAAAMSTLPRRKPEAIAYLENRIAMWVTEAANLGLSVSQASDLNAAIAAASGGLDAAEQARALSRAATVTYNAAYDEMRTLAGAAIKSIRAYALTTDDPSAVYALAQIPPPADPQPAPAPAAPGDITFELQSTGALLLRWKAPQPAPGAEVFTSMSRKLDGQMAFTTIFDTGAREFLDDTIPPGTASVQYVLRAKRGSQISAPSNVITIYLGAAGNEGAGQLSIAA
jgi:hypothetical protein